MAELYQREGHDVHFDSCDTGMAARSIDPFSGVHYNSAYLAGTSSSLAGDRMVLMRPGISQEEILLELTERARALWGEERANVIATSLESAARQLWEIGQNPPDRTVEPGFYQ